MVKRLIVWKLCLESPREEFGTLTISLTYDLPLSVLSQVRLFADDNLLYHKTRNQQDHQILQNDLNELEKRAKRNRMRFNAKKVLFT